MQRGVSVVVLNWNGIRFIETCLSGIYNQSYKKIQVVLVDNASEDSSLEKVINNFKKVKIIRNKTNLGYAKGMNIGISACTGEYILILNIDVYLDKYCIQQMVNSIEENNYCGAVMGKELTWNESGFFNMPTISSGPGYLRKRGQGTRDMVNLNERVLSFGAMGSFPMFRSSCLMDLYDNIGYYFDPKFVTGWEDKDIFFRLHHLGYYFLYDPCAIGYHYGSGSVQGKKKLIDKDNLYQTRIIRNRYYFILKNYPNWLLIRHSGYLLITEILFIIYLLFRSPISIKALFSAQLELKRNLNLILRDRKKIQSKSKLSRSQIYAFFKEY